MFFSSDGELKMFHNWATFNYFVVWIIIYSLGRGTITLIGWLNWRYVGRVSVFFFMFASSRIFTTFSLFDNYVYLGFCFFFGVLASRFAYFWHLIIFLIFPCLIKTYSAAIFFFKFAGPTGKIIYIHIGSIKPIHTTCNDYRIRSLYEV